MGHSFFGENHLASVFLESARPHDLKTLLQEELRGTRGTFASGSGGEDDPVPRKFLPSLGKFVQGDVDGSRQSSQLLDLLRAAHIQDEGLALLDLLVDLAGLELRNRLSGQRKCQKQC